MASEHGTRVTSRAAQPCSKHMKWERTHNKDEGKRKEIVKKLGFGLMRLPITEEKNPQSIDQELLNKMVDYYLEKGFTYFDTAYRYHQGMSEVALRRALVERHPRGSFTITDKCPLI